MAPRLAMKKAPATTAPKKSATTTVKGLCADIGGQQAACDAESLKRKAKVGLDLQSPMKRALRKNYNSADRALKEKFWYVDKDAIDAMETEDAGPAHDVHEEMKKYGEQKAYLPAEFWVELMEKWRFPIVHAYDCLPEPTVVESVRAQLNEAIKATRDPNPGARRIHKWEKFLMYCGDLNYTELFGCLKACVPEINTAPSMICAMERLLLQKICDDELDLKWPNLWTSIEDHMSQVAIKMWRSDAIIGRKDWVEQNSTLVDRFIAHDHWSKLESDLEGKVESDLHDIRRVLVTPLGEELYAELGTKFNWMMYCDQIKKGLQSLVDHSFDDIECANFKQLMGQEVQKLQDAGAVDFETKDMHVDFVGKQGMKMQITDANDQWFNAYEAQKKTIMISNKTCLRLPWEDMYIGENDKIPGVPETVMVPTKDVAGTNKMRGMVLRVLKQECRSNSLDEWKRVMKKNRAIFKRHCSTWDLEDIWLSEHFEQMLIAKVESRALGLFPTEEENADRQIGPVIKGVEALKLSAEVLCLGANMVKALNGVTGFLKKLQEGSASFKAEEYAAMTSFQSRVVQASSAFVHIPVTDKVPLKSPYFGKRHLHGQFAIQYAFGKLSVATQGDPVKSLTSPLLADLKIFKWLLGAQKQNQIKCWVREAARQRKATILGGCIEDGVVDDAAKGDHALDDVAVGSPVKASASSAVVEPQDPPVKESPIVLEPVVAPKTSGKTAKPRGKMFPKKKESAKSDALAKMFGKKATVATA